MIFEDNSVLAIATVDDDKITFVTAPASALDDKDIEAFPTFDRNSVVVAINENALPYGAETPEEAEQALMDLLAKGTKMAEQLFGR